jgi:hypothetical protein
MSSQKEKDAVEQALLDVELAMRYNSFQHAINTLETVLAQFPRNTDVRWKLAELYYQQGSPHTSAEQLFIISDIYIAANQLEFAQSTLLKIKQVYPPAEFHVDTRLATLTQYQALSQLQKSAPPEPAPIQPTEPAVKATVQPTQPAQPTQPVQNIPAQVEHYQNPYQPNYQDPYQNPYQNPYQPNQNPYQPSYPYPQPSYHQYYPTQYPPTYEAYQPTQQSYDQAVELESLDIPAEEVAKVQAAVTSDSQSTSTAPLAGDLHYINLFDVIQTLEKNEITGILRIQSDQAKGNLYLNRGLLADAICGDLRGKAAVKSFAEVTEGSFELEKSPVEFHQSIKIESNAKLILEIFSEGEEDEAVEEESSANDQSEEINW